MSQLSEQQLGEKRFETRTLARLRREWKIIAVFVIAALVLAVLYLRTQTYSYPVRMQLTSVQTNGDDSGSSRLNALSGLAALATAALPPSQNALQFRLFLDSLHSRDTADELAKNQDVMKHFFGDQWDEATQSWREPPRDPYVDAWNSVRDFLGLAPSHPWQKPSGLDLFNLLNRELAVDQDPRKPYMVTITLTSRDADFAIDFLNILTRNVDDELRRRALARSRAYIDYLSMQLSKVTIAEHRAALTQSLSEQEKYAMVASSGAPFSAEVFEKPWASTLPAAPVPRLILALATLMGAAVGSVFGLIVNRFRRPVSRRKAQKLSLAAE